MKLCAIILSCVVSFVLPTAFAQTNGQQPKRVVGKPRPKVQPRKTAPPPPATSGEFEEEMNDAAAGSAVQPPTRRYVAPAPPESFHELGDLVFQTPVSKFQFNLNYSTRNTTIEQRSNSFLLSTNKNSTQVIGATAEYGLFHHFALGLSWDYQLAGNYDTDLPSGIHSRSQQLGMRDPLIYGSYLLMDQDEGPLNLLLSLGYSPKMGTATDATTTSNGNALRGNDAVFVSGGLSKKISGFELGGALGFTSFGSGTSESAASGALKGSQDGYTAFQLQAAARTGFWIMHLQLGVDLISTSSYSSTSSSGSKTNYPQNSVFSYSGAIDFDIVRDVCVLGLNYRMTPSYTFDATTSSNSTINAKINSNDLTAKLSFLF